MAAIVLSLVYRQINYLTDVLRCLEVEGLLWVEAMSVSRQALSQRLESLPAELFIKLFEQITERLAAKKNTLEVAPMWTSVAQKFGAVWVADASTLEAVKKHLGQLQQKTGAVLGGKMLMVVEAFSHRPVAAFFDADAKRNETNWWGELTERLPVGGLLIYLWVGGTNGIRMQVYATWIFYAVLNDLCTDVAVALQQPIERISFEMVFRSLYFFHHALLKNPQLLLIPWLIEYQRSMGLVKAVRRRHRRNAATSLDIWASALT